MDLTHYNQMQFDTDLLAIAKACENQVCITEQEAIVQDCPSSMCAVKGR